MSAAPDPAPARPSLDALIGVDFPSISIDVALAAVGGDIVGLVGPNGAGKTTVLRALAGLQPIDRGRIVVDRVTVDDPDADVLAAPQDRNVGVVFQDYRLFPHLSALENVAFGLRCRARTRSTARRVALDWLERVDLADHAAHKPATLSGGQAQRVALARALATEPALLLLDEPLAAIDPLARARIREDLRRYLDGFGGITLVVSHHHDELRSLATTAVVLEAGRVVWTGPGGELP